MTNYEAVWQVLADLIAELRKSSEAVPPHVMKDLRSAKTMIQILKVDKDNPSHLLRIEEFLGNVESYIIRAAERRFGEHTLNSWMDRLDKARSKAQEDIQPLSKFVAGVPRNKHWIRVKTAEDFPLGKIELAAEEEGLELRHDRNGYIVIYGERRLIQNFIKRVTQLTRIENSDTRGRLRSYDRAP